MFVIPLTKNLRPKQNVRPLIYYCEQPLENNQMVEVEIKVKRKKEFKIHQAVVIKTEPLKKIEIKQQGVSLKRIYRVFDKKITPRKTKYPSQIFKLPPCLPAEALAKEGKNNGLHNFPYAGANCLICGTNQYEMSGYKGLKRIAYKPKELSKKIHSQEHWLASQLSSYFNEPRSFGMYLGIIKNKGFQKVYTAFSETKQSKVKDKVKLFMWKIKQISK